jgi:secreted PhoX family phosphatase
MRPAASSVVVIMSDSATTRCWWPTWSAARSRRFLTGPKGCEIAGLTATPDGRNLFINVQHPGEVSGGRANAAQAPAGSGWPASQFAELTGGRPRSATVVIRRQDGGVVGA